MQALERLRKAGFVPGISPAGGLLIEPASRLTAAQRAYIRAHKVLLVEALRAEQAAPPLPVARPEQVCCGDCAHSVLSPDTCPVYGWRLCGLGLEGGGGFGRAVRRCEKWAV